MRLDDNIVKCPDCEANLIEEESETHQCKTKGIQWFFKGEEFWGNDGSGWFGINTRTLASPDTQHPHKSPEDTTEYLMTRQNL